MHTLREFLHNVHALRRLKCRHDLALRGIRLAHAHVFQKAALDETAVLAHEGHRIHQLILVHVLHMHAADQHIAALRIKESGEQVRQRGLAAAGGPHKGHRLPLANAQRNIFQRVLLAVVAESHVLQRHRASLRVPGLVALGEGRAVQHAVNAGERVLHQHVVFAHVHQLAQRHRHRRRDDDIEQQVQHQLRRDCAAGQPEAAEDQEHEHAVDRQRVQAHGHAHFLGVGDRPALVIINGGLEFLEREHRLTEGLDYGNAPDVFNGLAGHIRQRILVLDHFLLHTLAGHLRHDGKAQRHRREAQQTQPPVKNRQQGQQSYDGRHDLCLVRELMRQIRFRRTGGFGDGATESAAAELLDGAQRQGSDMPCHGQPQIGGDAERGQV